jgi:uncharacterized protein (DUF1800 family)
VQRSGSRTIQGDALTSTADMNAAIAATRFGLGARPGELDAARGDPQGWLKAQVAPGRALQPQGQLSPTSERLVAFGEFVQMRLQARQDGQAAGAPQPVRAELRDAAGAEFLARAQLGCTTDASFAERWALFWCNHFTASATKAQTAVLVGPFEREAIRPHAFGRFLDMLLASTRHPAMLTYLDQQRSIGPDSMAGERRKAGLNENLAREIMELHTLGVGNYAQADVTEFAKALTGWSFVGPNERNRPAGRFLAAGAGRPGDFLFRAAAHEPGERTILGKRYRDDGEAQAQAALADFARHPATARHIAVKLGRHFVADDPPPAVVAALAETFTRTDGDLSALAVALVRAPDAWRPIGAKFKTPYEFLVSSYRAVGAQPMDIRELALTLTQMGQKPFSAPSPKGWPEETGDWAAPDAIMKRISWSEQFVARSAPADGQPVQWAQAALGAKLTPAVLTAVSRAESRPEALAILLMSPEFQRR